MADGAVPVGGDCGGDVAKTCGPHDAWPKRGLALTDVPVTWRVSVGAAAVAAGDGGAEGVGDIDVADPGALGGRPGAGVATGGMVAPSRCALLGIGWWLVVPPGGREAVGADSAGADVTACPGGEECRR